MKHLKLVSVLLLSVVLFGVNSCGSESSPSNTVKTAYHLMKSKDFEKVTALYVTRDGKKFSEEEAKKIEGLLGMAAKEDFDSKNGLQNIVIDKETIDEDGNEAEVEYTVNFKNGDSEKEDASLIKIDGKWYIKV
jgi:uncharacterized protein YchJ